MKKTDQQIQNEHIRTALLLLNWNDIFNADIYERITVNAQRRFEQTEIVIILDRI